MSWLNHGEGKPALPMFKVSSSLEVPVAFVAEMVTVLVPGFVGVPLMRPVPVLIDKPAGRPARVVAGGRIGRGDLVIEGAPRRAVDRGGACDHRTGAASSSIRVGDAQGDVIEIGRRSDGAISSAVGEGLRFINVARFEYPPIERCRFPRANSSPGWPDYCRRGLPKRRRTADRLPTSRRWSLLKARRP